MNQRVACFMRALRVPALTLCLVGCRSAGDLVPVDCLPGENSVAAVELGPSDANALGVWLDVSQSSTNFGRGGGESAYRDLIVWLLELQSDFAETRSYGFAERIVEIDESVFMRAARGDVNPCPECGFRETRLDDVLAELAAPESRATLNLVITDLWLDNSALIASARLALQGPIRSILADGRAIGVMGVAAPYADQVYDLPNATGASTIPAGRIQRRPVFVLLIGPPEQVVALEQRIAREVNGDRAEQKFSLFTPTLVYDGVLEPRLAPRSPAVRPAYILPIEDASVPGFLIDRRAIDPLAGDDATGERGLAAPISGAGGNMPSLASYGLGVEAWTLVPPEPAGACAADAWVLLDVGRTLEVTTDGGGAKIELDVSHPDLLGVRPGEIAFIRYRVTAGALEGGPGTAWLREWSFDAEDTPALVADPPSLFPALNLAEFGRVLESAMSEQVAGETVAEGGVLLSVE